MTDYEFNKASQHIPGGVNSPARSFKSVKGTPITMHKALGPYLWDTAHKRYIDYVCSWGPLVLGHNHPEVVSAVKKAVQRGLSFGTPCPEEAELAELVCSIIPSMDKVRFVNSGTEATMSALRVARAATGKNKIIKFEGCYHGHHDALLVKAGSGAMTLGEPSSPGVPEGFTQYTYIAQYNEIDSVERIFSEHGDDIAAVIVEPVAGNMGCVPPKEEFLPGLRQLCDRYNSLLIFDEVMTGFRVAWTGAQGLYQVTPDLTALGKIIGGGMPVGAFGGRSELMDYLAPQGPVYQAGTLAGNPVTMAAGLATLQTIQQNAHFYQTLTDKTQTLAQMIKRQAQQHDIPVVINQIGGMMSLFFTDQQAVTTHQQAQRVQCQRFARFFHALIDQSVYCPPSPFECIFMSQAHDQSILEATEIAVKNALAACMKVELS